MAGGINRREALVSILKHGGYADLEAKKTAAKLITIRADGGKWRDIVKKLLEDAPTIIQAVLAILALFA